MKDNKKVVNDYIDANVTLNTLVNLLEELKKEKEEILELAGSKKPPQDILQRMEANALEYKKLLEESEKFKKETAIFNKKTKRK